MKKQTFILMKLMACLALVLAFTAGWGPGAVLATFECDPNYVTQQGSTFTVLPTGTDDTANLQCAFDAAVEAGPGAEVRLLAGNYYTAQIVVFDFYGSFAGAGAGDTAVLNLPNMPIGPGEWNLSPPSAENPYPILFYFADGDFSISQMAFRIVGDEPMQPWTVYGIDPPLRELACAVAVMGTETYADIGHVLVEGEIKEGSFFAGYNLGNGIYYEGCMEWLGQPPPPISGSFSVHDSTFRTHAFATPVDNLSDASVVITHNDYTGIFVASDGDDLVNVTYEFSHNTVEDGPIGLDLWDNYLPEHVGSTYLVTNNVFRTDWVGVMFEQTFGAGNECLILGNNVQGVADLGIYLGPATIGCTVVGGGNRTNVLDLGTDNVLVGVNNMGSGVGPEIQRLLIGY
jgi:hypothetical protein